MTLPSGPDPSSSPTCAPGNWLFREIRARNSVLDEQCDKLGRDPSTVLRSLYYWIARSDQDPWSSLDAFHDLVGRYRQAGITEFVIDLPRPDQEAVLERVAAEALPALRAAQG